MTYEIEHGDVLEFLRTLPSGAFDALFCDPPYGLSFMGKRWDYDVPSAEVWAEALRVLKPGAPLLAFGGTRTYHRMVVNIEDGGFEIRDTIAWIYGSGFPKSQNISKALDAQERFGGSGSQQLRARDGRTLGQVGTNMGTHRSGNNDVREIPRCECGHAGNWHDPECAHEGCVCQTYKSTGDIKSEIAAEWSGYGTALKPALEPICVARKPLDGTMAENVGAYGVGGLNIDGTRIDCADKLVRPAISRDDNTAYGTGLGVGTQTEPMGRWPANVILDEEAGAVLDAQTDSGASRFFYCAKANRKEREAGCEALPARAGYEAVEREPDTAGLQNPRAGAGRTAGQVRNYHPTVKPLDLCRYLAMLIRPPSKDAVLLVPYSGSGSEMIGAMLAGWADVLGIEGDAEYIRIAETRLRHWAK